MASNVYDKLFWSLSVIIVGLTIGLIFQFARAWVEPSASPPGGNIAAPINTGSYWQSKSGGLTTHGLYSYHNNYGVYGYEPDTGARGILGYRGYGGYFIGSSAGGYFYESDTGTNAYVSHAGYGSYLRGSYRGIYAHGPNLGGYFRDSNNGTYGLIGYGGWGGWFNGAVNINRWDSQLYQGYGYSRRSIGGAHGWNRNMLYVNGFGDWRSGVSIGGPGRPSNLTVTGSLCLGGVCKSSWPSISERDTLYSVTHRGTWTNKWLAFAGFSDSNNGNYYINPNETSRLNYGVYNNLYSYGWMKAPIIYDRNNTGYYLNPASTSRLNYGVFNNSYNYGNTSANYVRGRTGLCIGNDCRTKWPKEGGQPVATGLYGWCRQVEYNCHHTYYSCDSASLQSPAFCQESMCSCPPGYKIVKLGEEGGWDNCGAFYETYQKYYSFYSCVKK